MLFDQGRRTYGIDRQILDYREHENRLSVPRGCLPLLELADDVVDERATLPVKMPRPSFTLRDYQQQSIEYVGDRENGVIVAPTGAGKTVLGISLMARRL